MAEFDKTVLPAVNKSLYGRWLAFHNLNCSEEFQVYSRFYKWSLENGFRMGAVLKRKDYNEPYSPENCVWTFPRKTTEKPMSGKVSVDPRTEKQARASIERWNKTVNRIRKAYGMCPVEELTEEERFGNVEDKNDG